MISVLIPFRAESTKHRTKLKDWIVARWTYLLPEAEIVLGKDTGGKPFSKTTAVNDAFSKCSGDVLIVTDADTWLERNRIERAVSMVQQKQRLVVPWSKVIRINQECTKELLAEDPASDLDLSTLDVDRGSPDPITAGTVYAINRVGFETVNGMDPRFRGWGFEDIAFRRACDALLGGATYLHMGVAYSLWHPAPTIEGKGRVWTGDAGRLNMVLNDQYMRAERDPALMRALCNEHPLGQLAAPITPWPIQEDPGGGMFLDGKPYRGEFIIEEVQQV